MTDAMTIYQWQLCEEMAARLKFRLATNADKIISVLENGKFLYNANTVSEVQAFLTAYEQCGAIRGGGK